MADAQGYEPDLRGHLEAQIANIADELAYTAHDLDDGMRSVLISPAELEGLELWEVLRDSIGWHSTELDDLTRHRLIRRLIGMEVSDLLDATVGRMQPLNLVSVEQLQRLDSNMVGFSDNFRRMNQQLKSFLFQNMYQHHRVVRMQTKAERILEDLFNAYIENPEVLPSEVQERARAGELHRTICDYIAGMTDRFAQEEHSKLFDPLTRP